MVPAFTNLYRAAPADTNQHQPAPTCTGLHQTAPGGTNRHRPAFVGCPVARSDEYPHPLVIALAELPGCASLPLPEGAVEIGYVVETTGVGYLCYCLRC